jgi:hypothetical protein
MLRSSKVVKIFFIKVFNGVVSFCLLGGWGERKGVRRMGDGAGGKGQEDSFSLLDSPKDS